MNTNKDTNKNSGDATASMKGYVYQQVFAIEKILNNKNIGAETIKIEGVEDVDITFLDKSKHVYQLKYYNGASVNIYEDGDIMKVIKRTYDIQEIKQIYFLVASDNKKIKNEIFWDRVIFFEDNINDHELIHKMISLNHLGLFDEIITFDQFECSQNNGICITLKKLFNEIRDKIRTESKKGKSLDEICNEYSKKNIIKLYLIDIIKPIYNNDTVIFTEYDYSPDFDDYKKHINLITNKNINDTIQEKINKLYDNEISTFKKKSLNQKNTKLLSIILENM